MPYRYRAFGLSIAADAPIPGMLAGENPALAGNLSASAVEDASRCDLRIDLARDDAWSSEATDILFRELPEDATGCTLQIWRDLHSRGFRLLFGDGSEFLIDREGGRIAARWNSNVGVDGMSVYLLGPVLGFALRLRGTTCLHASAVSDGTDALAVVAGGGRGKSTTAAAFARRGVAVLTDDLLALREDESVFWAQPAYPRIRLWPRAVKGLFGSEDALPRITPDDPAWDKRFVDLSAEPFRFCSREVPLAALYVGVHDEGAGRPVLEEVSGRETLLTMLSNSYSHRMPGREMRAGDFDRLARLAQHVPLRRFRMGEGFGHLDELCTLLLEDCRACARAGA